jgi:hypothetical protein
MRVRWSLASLWVFLTLFLLVACDPGPLAASLEAFVPGLPEGQAGLLADVPFSPISPPPTPTDPTSPLPTPTNRPRPPRPTPTDPTSPLPTPTDPTSPLPTPTDPISPLPTATALPPVTPPPPTWLPGPSVTPTGTCSPTPTPLPPTRSPMPRPTAIIFSTPTPTPERTQFSVTGGGWIESPPGAYTADPALAGQASFGLVVRYRRGVALPTGRFQFHLAAARLQLHATTFESLQIEGARATFRGVGTLREAGGTGERQARFLVSVIDDQIDGSGLDRLRIKIWDLDAGNAIVYDSQRSAPDNASPTTPLSGGSIVIHTGR